MSQQDWVKDLMLHIITTLDKYNATKGLFSKGYWYPINGAIDTYTSTYYDNKKQVNISLYQNYYKNFIDGNYQNILLSQQAYNLLSHEKNKINDEKKLFHGEHLTPMSYTRKFLNELLNQKLSIAELKKEIDFAFSHAKLCIITKEEQKWLDGKGQNFAKEEIEQFLTKYRQVKKELSPETEKIYRDLAGKIKRSYGFGAIRLWVMQKQGVAFVDSNGAPQSFDKCIEYLENNNYAMN